jgi:lipoprotein-anchoring transpeptidase ErfK/SrfK
MLPLLFIAALTTCENLPPPQSQATPTPVPIYLTEEALDPKNLQTLLLQHPEAAKEKTHNPLKVPPTLPKNLQTLLTEDTGITFLHIAAALGDTNLTQSLLQLGANRWSTTNKYKALPVELALENKNFETARCLLNAPPSATDYKIHVNLADQSLQVYIKGQIVLTSEISSGKKGHSTKPGEYLIAEKDPHHKSNLYPEGKGGAPMPYFSRLSYSAMGFHQGSLPGYPASHGCIRLPLESAKFIFNTCPIGTYVVVD